MSRNPYLEQAEILLQTIVEAQSMFVDDEDLHSGFDHILTNLMKLTDSQYGFIGEVLTNEQRKPFLKTHAITNIAWNEETRKLYNQFAPNLEFTNLDNLFGKVIVSGQHVIANSPSSDPRRGGLPKEHPPLKAFLGVPFYHGSNMVGMAGIANRPGGYNEQLVEFLQPLLTFCGTVVQAQRNDENQRQAELARREVEERLYLVLDASGSGIWDWNIQSGHVYYSKNWVESLGYHPKEVPPSIEFWKDLVHPEDWPKVTATLSEHFEGKTQFYECENRLRMASGDWRWNLDRGRVVEWDTTGKPFRMVGVDIDISKHKRLEEKNLSLQHALDHGREGCALLDETGHYTYINSSHAEQYGYTSEELMGESWHRLYGEKQCIFINDTCFPVLKSQGWWQGELEGTKKNGETFDVEIFLTLLKGQQKGLLCTCRDITERKKLAMAKIASDQGILELHEIASRHYDLWDERMAALLEMGCRRFNLPIGVLTHLASDRLRFEFVHAPHNEVAAGLEFPKDQIFCGETLKTAQPLSFEHASLTNWKYHPGAELLGLEAYIGAPIFVGEVPYGTLAFVSQQPVQEKFNEGERNFIQLMAQWVGKEISRQRSDELLRESEQRFELAIWGSNDGLWDWPNIEEDAEWWSPRFYELLGYEFEEFPATLTNFKNLLHPEDCERVFEAVRAHFDKQFPFDIEYRLRMKSGVFRWFHARGKAVKNHNGVVTRMAGSIQDIHERHQSEAALRESESKLQAILDGSSSVIYMKDLSGRYVHINREYEDLFHLKREEVRGLTDFDLFPQEIAAAFQGNDQMVVESKGPLMLEEIAPQPDGPHTFMSNKFPLLDTEGVPYAICGISTDITDRKRAEHALHESEIRFRNLADSAPVLIWESGIDKLCNYFNQQWLNFTGRPLEQELGVGWAEGVHPDDYKTYLDMYTTAFDARAPFEMEYRLKHVSGAYRWIIDRGVPRFSSNGKFLGYIGSCSDISEQKHHQEAIRQYNQSLKEEVHEQTTRIQELEQRRMQVEKLAALSQVTAGVAHEINNPLASIKQSFHLVRKLLPAEHPRLKYVGKIDEEIDRIAHIIQKMYQLYQPRQDYPQLLDLGKASMKAMELIQGLQKGNDVPVKMRLHEKLLMLPLPPTDVHQVLCNLLQNAFEAVEGKGKITISTGMDARYVWIRIADNGPGIPTDVLPYIFDPFFSTKGPGSGIGMGLGLSVSKSLVEAMGGVLEVDSKLGSGTTFTILISLPLVPTYPNYEGKIETCPAKVTS